MLQTEIHRGERVALEVDHRPNEPVHVLLSNQSTRTGS